MEYFSASYIPVFPTPSLIQVSQPSSHPSSTFRSRNSLSTTSSRSDDENQWDLKVQQPISKTWRSPLKIGTRLNLPHEVVDAIIDQVQLVQDNGSHKFSRGLLGVCTLVCTSFLPRSRFHLFGNAVLDGHNPERARQFLSLIKSPMSTFPMYVHALVIKSNGGRLNANLNPLTRLAAVESLSFINGEFRTLDTRQIKSIFASFTTLKKVDLKNCHFRRIRHLTAIIYASQSLEHIGLDLVHVDGSSSSSVPDIRPPPHLKSLKIHTNIYGTPSCASTAFVKWLMSGSLTPAIHILDMRITEGARSEDAALFIQSLGSTLTHLTIGVNDLFQESNNAPNIFNPSIVVQNPSTTSDSFCSNLDLRHNRNLASLHVHTPSRLHLETDESLWRRGLPLLQKILNQVKSGPIAELALEVSLTKHENLDLLEWDTISSGLRKPNLKSLRKVRLIVEGLDGEHECEAMAMEAVMRKRLEDLDEHVIVVVESAQKEG